MSAVTYLITVDVPDPSFTEDVGLEIEDTLADNGFDVISVTAPPAPPAAEPLPPPLF
jgi:hypothetical protein